MLEKIEKENIQKFLDSFDTILTDCDGVLWNGPDAISGSVEAINLLKSLGKSIYYVTNNSTKSREEYVDKCNGLGYPANLESIIGSAYVAAHYIKDVLQYKGKVYLIGSQGLAKELQNVGIEHTEIGPDPAYGNSFESLLMEKYDPEIKCVVVGFDQYFSYSKCTRAASYLTDKQCHFVATNIDSGLPLGDRFVPGTGSIVQCVSFAAGREPDVICGKPEQSIFDIVMKKHDINPKRTIMIGDRLNTDIALAHNCGLLAGLMVLTGFNKLQDAKDLQESNDPEKLKQVPHFYVEKLGDIVDLIK